MKSYFILIASIFLFNSCDELEEVKPIQNGLNGQWELQSVSCFCFFEDDFDFTTSSVVFSATENTASFEHTEEAFVIATGVYGYTINNNQISFGDDRWFVFSIEDTNLTLSYVDEPEIADDEITYVFKKI